VRLREKLRDAGALQLLLPDGEVAPIALLPPSAQGNELVLRAQRPASDPPRRIAVQASDDQGRAIARMEMEFAAGATQAQTPFNVPNELRNRVVRLDVERQNGAGSAALLDERFRRRPVGVVGVPPSVYRRQAASATAGMPSCVAKQVTRPIRNREAPLAEPHVA